MGGPVQPTTSPRGTTMFRLKTTGCIAAIIVVAAMPAAAQISQREFAARRDSLAKRIDSGFVDRVRRTDADHGFRSVPPAAGVSLSHELRRARRGVRDGRAPRRGNDDVVRDAGRSARGVLLRLAPRLGGGRADARHAGAVVQRRSEPSSTRWPSRGLPLYTLDDFEDADFARADSLTRGTRVHAIAAPRSTRASW